MAPYLIQFEMIKNTIRTVLFILGVNSRQNHDT